MPGVDHVVERRLPVGAAPIDHQATHPFIRYRTRLSSYAVARAHGWTDAAFMSLVQTLDDAVAAVDGRGFRQSPLHHVTNAPAGVSIHAKLELFGVAGSHKARHLFGLMLWLRVQEQIGGLVTRPRLAIASCGNAALAAAVVARAAEWPISVFVPTDASAAVLKRLSSLDADVVVCERDEGVAGDPTLVQFRAAVAGGALPFCCQGTDNGLTIEGGETLGWEIAEASATLGGIDTLWVQVGGGALATGCWRGLSDAQRANVMKTRPRLVTVQTGGAWPLGRAWLRFVADVLKEPSIATYELAPTPESAALIGRIPEIAARAGTLWRADRATLAQQLAEGWHTYMQPWPFPPHSVAHGILDDETYDGRALVEAMLDSDGWPVIASETALTTTAVTLVHDNNSPLPVTATGASGLAGLHQFLEAWPANSHVDAAASTRSPPPTKNPNNPTNRFTRQAPAVGLRHLVLLTGLDRSTPKVSDA